MSIGASMSGAPILVDTAVQDVASTPAEKLPLTLEQAIEALETFRPIKACPADLEHLL